MSSTHDPEWTADGHPSDGVLLRTIDAESQQGEASRVAAHLDACWTCRAKVDQISGVIGAVVQFVEGPLTRNLPPLGSPATFERCLHDEAVRWRVARAKKLRPVRRWQLALAGTVLLVMTFLAQSGALAWITDRARWLVGVPQGPADNQQLVAPLPARPLTPLVLSLPVGIPFSALSRVNAPAVPTIQPAELAWLEVETLAALDAVGVLLGGQIEVSHSATGVEVHGLVEDESQRRAIMTALHALPTARALSIRIRTVEEGLRQLPPPTGALEYRPLEFDSAAIPAAPDLRAHLARSGWSGDIAAEVRLIAASALRRSRSALLHALAIESLVERYEARALQALNPKAYAVWQRLISTHAAAFVNETRQLRGSLEPAFVAADDPRLVTEIDDQSSTLDDGTRRLGRLAVGIDDAVRAGLTASTKKVERIELREIEFWRTVRRAERLAQAATKR